MRRNLVSGSLLNKARLKIVFKVDKVSITKNGEFMGKGYLADGLFILNIAVNFNISSSDFTYIAESIDLWHGRLGHVNFSSIKRLTNIHLIKTIDNKILLDVLFV